MAYDPGTEKAASVTEYVWRVKETAPAPLITLHWVVTEAPVGKPSSETKAAKAAGFGHTAAAVAGREEITGAVFMGVRGIEDPPAVKAYNSCISEAESARL